jgi:hypothetical protein
LQLAAAGTAIEGNFIGTDVTGTLDRGNLGEGVLIRDASNVVGGYGAAEGNVISGNGGAGVNLSGSAATGNTIWGNHRNQCGRHGSGPERARREHPVGTGNHIGAIISGGGNLISGTTTWCADYRRR